MPQAFDDCVKSGGRVRTKTLPNGKYIRLCFKDGKSHAGEVKEKKTTLKAAHKKALKPEPRARKVTYTPGKIQRQPWDKPATRL